MNAVLFAIIAYVLVQFGVGIWVSRNITTANDYILAGRRLGLGLVAFSVFATYFGAEVIVASGGAVYEYGLRGALVDPLAYAAGIILAGLFFAKALWSRGLTTFADLFRQRYSPGVEKLVVAVLLPGSIIWAAAQIRAFGQVMDANSGMGLQAAITIAAILVGAYTIVGGLMADAVTDVIQGLVVLLGLLVLGAVVAASVDGVQSSLSQVPPERLTLRHPHSSALETVEAIVVPICGTIVAIELISRFLGARTAQIAGRATTVGGLVYLAVGMIPVFLGLVGPQLLPNVPDPEQIVARLAEVYLPGLLYIAFIGAIISAILSVVHATLHAPAAQISHNVVAKDMPYLSGRGRLWLVRMTVLVLTIVAFVISFTSDGIKELVETASSFGSAGVFVATLFALFTRFGGPSSAYASVVAGVLFWAVGKYAAGFSTPYLLGLASAFAAYVSVALVEKQL